MIATPERPDVPSAAQCAPIVLLSLKILADLRAWTADHPALAVAPLEAMAMTAAAISPWRSAAELRLPARMYIWTYAFDDHVERDIGSLSDLDDFLERCRSVAFDGGTDRTAPLLSALSQWHAELRECPLYPALSGVWADKAESALRGIRYDWVTGRDPARRRQAAASEYLAHAASVLAGMTHTPRWITSGEPRLAGHLSALLPAMSDTIVAIRLANDLATHSWEREQDGQNNILMYGVSPEWVRGEIGRRVTAVTERMAPLADRNFAPAVEMVRHIEWATAFYALADFRGWGSDVPVPAESGA